MENRFFEKPILNSPYEYPRQHWELDAQGQPTQQSINARRKAEYITPIPKPRKQRASAAQQDELIFDEGKGLSTQAQQYDPTPIINELRYHVDQWRSLPNPKDWRVEPETARLLQLHLIVEIKGYRREDAKIKKSTMETYWVPGVNNLRAHGRWAFAEFTEVYQIESEFKEKVEAEFNRMIEGVKGEGRRVKCEG